MDRTRTDTQQADGAPSRRQLLSAVGAVGVAGLSGCIGTDLLFGDGTEFNAEAAIVADASLSETGYEEYQQTAFDITRTYEAAGQQREVRVTNQLVEYDRAIEILGQRIQGAIFTVLSTPKVDILGRTFNPIGEMETDELVAELQSRYEQIRSVQRDSTRTQTVLGQTVEVTRYRAEAQPTDFNFTVDLTLHVTAAIDAGDDFVVCLGAHPRLIDETDTVNELLGGVEHLG